MSTPAGHRRFNPLTGDWVLISPHRLDRPWQGARSSAISSESAQSYDPDCYLCPGNTRANGETNPDYRGVYVFDNDFPALQCEPAQLDKETHPLFRAEAIDGVCRVVCFSPHHSDTLSDLSVAEVTAVVAVWAEQSTELGERYPQGTVQIFENKGEMMGCSNPHPHGQIWAHSSLSGLLEKELLHGATYADQHGHALLDSYVEEELRRQSRIVCSNDEFLVLVPYWATWPFETLVCHRGGAARLAQLNKDQQQKLAVMIRELSIRYDHLFGVSFPYSAGLHQAPASGRFDLSFRLHMHFYPPLLRSAQIKKFMVGYEMLAQAQRDLTPEAAAEILRQQPSELVSA